MNELNDLMKSVFATLVEKGVAKKFAEMMRLRAEMCVRNIPNTPVENRPLAEGQILICYELADGAMNALETSEAEAKVKEAERIRAELQLAEELTAGGIP